MKNSKKIYYSLAQNEDTAILNIFGDITSFPWLESDVSNLQLSKKLEELKDVSVIDVYINSYGGEVAEGLAIYNALKRHKAKVITHVDGFACSIASVIFMAGDERVMPNTSCLMIHNPWTYVSGSANELRKQAEDLEKIGECSINAYLERINISKEELKQLLDNESWISPSEAVEMGFATSAEKEDDEEHANQSVKSKVIAMLLEKEDTDGPNSDSDDNQDEDIDTDENEESSEDTTSNDEETDTDNIDSDDDVSENDSSEEDEEENENNEETDDEKPSEKATKYFGAFFSNLEREILK